MVVSRWQGGETKYDICALNELFSLRGSSSMRRCLLDTFLIKCFVTLFTAFNMDSSNSFFSRE